MPRRTDPARIIACLLLAGVGCGGTPQGAEHAPAGPPLEVSIQEVRFDQAEREAARESAAESVRVRASLEHMEMPAAEVDGGPDPDAWPQVTLMNDTAHGMLIWLSGPCARTIALPAHSQNSVEVCEGSYQIAGQISEGHFLPLVGEQDQLGNGYHYLFTFYVQSDPYRPGRRRRRRRR